MRRGLCRLHLGEISSASRLDLGEISAYCVVRQSDPSTVTLETAIAGAETDCEMPKKIRSTEISPRDAGPA